MEMEIIERQRQRRRGGGEGGNRNAGQNATIDRPTGLPEGKVGGIEPEFCSQRNIERKSH